MTVITTSTSATATAYSNQRKIDRTSNGVLWTMWGDNVATVVVAYPAYSTDDGETWTSAFGSAVNNGSGGTVDTYVDDFSFFIDSDDYCHVVFKDNQDGLIYYRRGTPNAARTAWTWSSPVGLETSTTDANYPDVIAHREGTGWVAHVVWSRVSGTNNTANYKPVTITSGGSATAGSLTGIGGFGGTYSNSIHTYPSIDFNHTGDGKTVAGSTPHLYAAWSAGATGAGDGIRFKKATYSGGSWTWGTEREIDSTRTVNSAERWLNCLFDGTRVIIGGMLSGPKVVLYERDAADTTTTTYVLSPANDRLQYGCLTYDSNTADVYLFGDDLTGWVYYKWNRSTTTLGSSVTIVNSAATTPRFSAKRGSSESFIEFIYTDGTASPYDVVYDGFSTNQAPDAPTLVNPTAGERISATQNTTFDWTFSDPDAGDTQSEYALRRKVVP